MRTSSTNPFSPRQLLQQRMDAAAKRTTDTETMRTSSTNPFSPRLLLQQRMDAAAKRTPELKPAPVTPGIASTDPFLPRDLLQQRQDAAAKRTNAEALLDQQGAADKYQKSQQRFGMLMQSPNALEFYTSRPHCGIKRQAVLSCLLFVLSWNVAPSLPVGISSCHISSGP
ncbi:unnamed protein product [Cladocopium goreaui]|uniref:Uncharacterized protein n=1 Tax=Cladocopium goreaui TaxID=2562237 RepID=A0A9P1BPL4_9DINO|nr:unnamed protein product [Cladocopium goreaui]